MGEKLIEIRVFKEHDGTPYPNAEVKIGGYDNLTTRTDERGKAVIILPYDSGTVSIYVNGKCVFDDYVYKIPSPLVVKATWSIW
jgi:hypothetical protein